jgi:hypothetical protein
MLRYETVDAPTLELLKKLKAIEAFKELRMVGDTSLALQYGHRTSVDIDLFGKLNIDAFTVNNLVADLGEVKKINDSRNIHIYIINDIKTDIVNYQYPWIGKLIREDGLRLADKKDIAAMKLAAISGRGTKKDLYDLYLLLKEIPLSVMLKLYQKKYKDGSLFLVLKSLVYFDDADKDVMPRLIDKVPWNMIKKTILNAYSEYMKNI